MVKTLETKYVGYHIIDDVINDILVGSDVIMSQPAMSRQLG